MIFSKYRQTDFEMLKKVFKETFSGEPWNDDWSNEEQLEGYLADLTSNNNSLTFVIKDEKGHIIAGALGYTFRWWQGSDYYIKEFFVKESVQGQGIGSRFIEEIEEHLGELGLNAVWLMTERNFPAYRFYEKNGFRDFKDTVVMYKSLD